MESGRSVASPLQAGELDFGLAYDRIVQLIGCKWSVRILLHLHARTDRPCELVKSIDGISSRVLHRCLTRMERDGLVNRRVLDSVPPHTEYSLTDQGREFVGILHSVELLARHWEGTQPPVRIR